MFDKLFGRKKDDGQNESDETQFRQAIAALLVEAAKADNHYEDQEKAIIDKSLAGMFELSPGDAAKLRTAGETAQDEALDIQRFTRHAKQMSQEEKIAFAERMWEIILSDGERDPFEDALMRRLCGLIYLDDQESGAARARVAARLKKA